MHLSLCAAGCAQLNTVQCSGEDITLSNRRQCRQCTAQSNAVHVVHYATEGSAMLHRGQCRLCTQRLLPFRMACGLLIRWAYAVLLLTQTHKLRQLFLDIKFHLITEFLDYCVEFCPRACNSAAHVLAARGMGSQSDHTTSRKKATAGEPNLPTAGEQGVRQRCYGQW